MSATTKRSYSRLILILLFASSKISFSIAQNLVPNPSFETYTTAPTNLGQLVYATPWYGVNGTPDFFYTTGGAGANGMPTNWFGNQVARTGSGYGGIAYSSTNSYHEMMGVPLTTALTIGQVYYFEAYVSAGEGPYMYGTNNFGAYLSVGAQAGVPAVTPNVNWLPVITDYTNWTQVSGTFTALTAANYLTLGNFYSTGATTWTNLGAGGAIASQYWYIEDVVVQPAGILPLELTNLSIRLKDKVTTRVEWATDNRSSVSHYLVQRSIDGGQSFVEAGKVVANPDPSFASYSFEDKPEVSSQIVTYRIKEVQNDGAVHFSEQVEVYLPFPGLQDGLTSSPNPTQQGQTISLSFPSVPGEESATVTVFDVAGRNMYSVNISQQEGMNHIQLPIENLVPGIYFVKVTSGVEFATTTIRIVS